MYSGFCGGGCFDCFSVFLLNAVIAVAALCAAARFILTQVLYGVKRAIRNKAARGCEPHTHEGL